MSSGSVINFYFKFPRHRIFYVLSQVLHGCIRPLRHWAGKANVRRRLLRAEQWQATGAHRSVDHRHRPCWHPLWPGASLLNICPSNSLMTKKSAFLVSPVFTITTLLNSSDTHTALKRLVHTNKLAPKCGYRSLLNVPVSMSGHELRSCQILLWARSRGHTSQLCVLTFKGAPDIFDK